ncbi:transglutaminase family protein [Mesorhizobium sp. AaZ16]|uniref:transglutaminase family protein n=1 Tax=Mesorhizobium sp. AaZ16 TaxID=3402289 RepID=UPI00374E7FF5
MTRFLGHVLLGWLLALATIEPAKADQPQTPAVFVRSIIDASQSEMDFARAKLAIDKFVDPTINEAAALAELDRMAATVERMLGMLPAEAASTSMEKMKALRAFIYEGGHWNGGRPFHYDLSDPMGQQPGAQLLTRYLASRKGNCVSMPTLFLALGERLGLKMTLSTAPLHLFVKWTDDATGETWNLETTSGAGFTRDEHYRKIMPMTDGAIANGVYLNALSRRESLSIIATGVLDHLLATGRYDEAIAVADVLIEAYSANAYAMVKKGTAYYRLLDRDFVKKYPKESDIPAAEMPRAVALSRANHEAFAKAEALGWREPNLN